MLTALGGWQSSLWTALPALVNTVDLVKQTITAQPAIMGQFLQQDGSWKDVTLPLLLDVPIIFPGGGGYTLTFPIAIGDEALIVFSSRCIDNWWSSGGIQKQAEFRMHDLSDGFAIVGPRSQPRKLSGVSANSVQLRSNDGTNYVEVAAGGVINVVAPTQVNITSPLVKMSGNLQVVGDITGGYGTGDQVGLRTHKHSGVAAGGAQTAAPVAGT